MSRLPEYFVDTFDHGGCPDTIDGLVEWHKKDALTLAGNGSPRR
jgi:hypothetical protein